MYFIRLIILGKGTLIHIIINTSFSYRIKCQLPLLMNDLVLCLLDILSCVLVFHGAVVLGVSLALLFIYFTTLSSLLSSRVFFLSWLFSPISPTFSKFKVFFVFVFLF